jgi:hypothetical protein
VPVRGDAIKRADAVNFRKILGRERYARGGTFSSRCLLDFARYRDDTDHSRTLSLGHRPRIDSPLEEDGFELVVPPRTKRLSEGPGVAIWVSDMTSTGSGFRAGVLDGRPGAKPFAGAGPAVRIRFAPALRPVRTTGFGIAALRTAGVLGWISVVASRR